MRLGDEVKLRPTFLMLLPLIIWSSSLSSHGSQFTVGDSVWSIPPTTNFYANWSSSYSFHAGDSLYFNFESGLYDVIEVSRGEYETCSANQAFRAWMEGPIILPLTQEGVFYFVCNISNYCALGLKVSVVVGPNKNSNNVNGVSSPSPSPFAI